MAADDDDVVRFTQRWLEKVVIGLNLCPFAKAVHAKSQVRYVVSHAETPDILLLQLERELHALAKVDAQLVDTTLLIHPRVFREFLDYNDFLSVADACLVELGLEGELQIASFHPEYCFADTETSDPSNFTNRSPYPMLHLLREASVTRAVESFPDAASISSRNIEALRAMDPLTLERLASNDE